MRAFPPAAITQKGEKNMEKKPYEEPEVTMVELDFSEVMTASPSCIFGYPDDDPALFSSICYE